MLDGDSSGVVNMGYVFMDCIQVVMKHMVEVMMTWKKMTSFAIERRTHTLYPGLRAPGFRQGIALLLKDRDSSG